MFLRPAGLGGRILGRGTGVVFGVLQRVTGVDLLRDLSVFFRSLGGMIDGFTERARRVGALLEDPGDDVPDRHRAAPRPGRGGDLLPPQAARGGDAVRRPRRQPRAQPPDDALPEPPSRPSSAPALAERVDRRARELAALAARDAANVEHLRDALGDPPTIVVPELDDDVHDVDGLALVRAHLFD